jgi:large subunit ribosomal protein L29
MKASEIREFPADELAETARELRERLFKLRFQLASGQMEKPQMIRNTRRDLARVLTILGERETES